MISSIIAFSIKNKLFVILMTIALVIAGGWSMTRVPLDAIPDITNNQVQVITTAPSLSTEDIEQFVTYPVELAMANLPGVMEIRSISRFGLSVVTIVFEENMGTYLPRQLVSEQLNEVEEEIPEGFGKPFMGPISTGLGEIYQYTIDPLPGYDTVYSGMELRTVQDWIVKRQMAMLPGVVEVNSFGGSVKQYEVALDPDRLNSLNIDILDVYRALEAGNRNTGGAYIERNHQAVFIRGEGILRSLRDIESIPVKTGGKAPVLIRDLGEVQLGSAVRYGAFTKNGKGEAVGGTIMMLKGANSNEVIENVKDRMEQVRESLPEGLDIHAFLDRSDLIERTSFTIGKNLAEGALIVVLVLVLLLGNLRGGLIIASIIPLSLLFAFILMRIFGVWANLMSLGAIDFGIIIDGAVIIVEGVAFQLSRQTASGLNLSRQQMDKVVVTSSGSLMNTAFFGQLIILIVFMPILALEGVEGKMFRPMAYTFGFAVLGAILLCLTYIPCMSALFLHPGRERGKFSAWVRRSSERLMDFLRELYIPVLQRALDHAKTTVAISLVLLAATVLIFTRMGGEFMPQLDEGDIAFHAILKPGSSLTETVEATTRIEKLILENFPEAEHVLSRIGVSDVPTDPMPMDMADVFVILKPEKEWVSAGSKEELIENMKETLALIPGLNYEFTQPIEMRFNELISGVREDIAVKLYGDDLDVLAAKAAEMGTLISGIDGVADMRVEATSGLPQLVVAYDRARLAEYGINVEALNKMVNAAFAGAAAGVIFEGEKRFDLVIRLDERYRADIRDLQNLYVSLPDGSQVPLSVLANIEYQPAPIQISRDDTRRRTYVGINVRERDIESLVEEIREKLQAELELPPGYYIEYGGAFENLERAGKRLSLVVPLALALIFLLLYFALHSLSQTLMIYMAIPLAAIGGVMALWLRGMPFSISAGVGFVVLFGVAVLNGLVLVSRFNSLKTEGVPLGERIRQGAGERLRPVLLTALAAITGFLPMAISTSAGAEVQRPLATVVIGGLLTSTLLTLLVLPLLYQWTEQRSLRHSKPKTMKFFLLVLCIAGTLTGLSGPNSAAAFTAPEISRGTAGFLKGLLLQTDSLVTLQEAREKARAYHPSMKLAELSVLKQKDLKETAWQFGDTRVFTGMEEAGGNEPGVQTLAGIGQQNVDIFGSFSRSKWRSELIRLSEINRKLTGLEVIKNTSSAYYQAAFARSRLRVSCELDSIYRRFEEAALLRFETGESPRLEYLAAKGKYQKVKLALRQAMEDYEIALAALVRWTGIEKPFGVYYLEEIAIPAGQNSLPDSGANRWPGPPGSNPGKGTNPGNAADSLVLKSNLLLEPFRQDIRVQQARIGLERAELLPSFSGEYAWQQAGGQKGFYSWQVGIQIPLWFIPQKGNIKAAKTEKKIAENRLLLEASRLQWQQRQLEAELQKARGSIDFYLEEGLPLAAEQITAAAKSYRYGETDYTAFIQLTDEAVRTRTAFLESLNNYFQAKNELQFISGKF